MYWLDLTYARVVTTFCKRLHKSGVVALSLLAVPVALMGPAWAQTGGGVRQDHLPEGLPNPFVTEPEAGPDIPGLQEDLGPQDGDENADIGAEADVSDRASAPTEPTQSAREREAAELDALFAELAQPGSRTWQRAESDILRLWSRSGSSAMDLLFKRGEAALDSGDPAAAIGHLTALTDHAPDFAAGWYMRGVAFYLRGDFGPAAADLARALELEPRHFSALTLMGTILEELGQTDRALEALRASLKIHPYQQEAQDGVTRLEHNSQGVEA